MPDIPEKPRKMSRGAKRYWDELVDEMAGTGVLCRVDKRALWQLAEDECLLADAYVGLWAMIVAIQRKARDEKKKLTGGAFYQLLNMTSGRMAMTAIRHLANRVTIERREFGLTPSSRCRVEAIGEPSGRADPLEMKLCG